MDDFFKQFRGNLNRRPEPDFEENDWRDLEKRLTTSETKRSVLPIFWWWVTAPVLLCSLGINGLFFKQLQVSKHEISALENRRDTVYLTRIENHTDTIYRINTVRERVIEYMPSAFANGSAQGAATRFSEKTGLPVQQSPIAIATIEEKQTIYQSEPKPGIETPNYSNEKPPVSDNIALLEMSLRPIVFAHNLPDISLDLEPVAPRKYKKTLPQILYPLRPRDFSIGASGGGLFPFAKGLNQRHGWSLGIEASVGFSPHLRLWAEGIYQKTGFLSERMDEALGIPFVPPPSDDFIFVNAETLQPMWQYGLGMQYSFNPNGTWHPFVGAGYGAVSILPYEVAYEFNNQQLNVQWDFDQRVNNRALLPGFMLLRAGIERPLKKRLNWNLMLSYRNNFGNSTFSAPPNLGLQMGLRF